VAIFEELLSQKLALEKKKLELETYLAEYRRVLGGLSEITYRQNSPIIDKVWEQSENIQRQQRLEDERRQLKKSSGMTPRRIHELIKECDSCIYRVSRELKALKNIGPEPELAYHRTGEFKREPTHTGVEIPAHQAQETSFHHSRTPSSAHADGHGYSALYKHGGKPESRGQRHNKEGHDR
jgi:hypothetical protein